MLCALGLRAEAELLLVRIKRLLVLFERVNEEHIGEGARVIPTGDDLARAQRLSLQQALYGLARGRGAHHFQVFDGVFMLNHLDEFLVDDNVIRADVLAVFQRNLDAELVELGLLVRVEPPMLEGRVVLLKLSEKTVGHLINFPFL